MIKQGVKMSVYKVIHGHFHVKGYSPDGDSIRFEADDAVHWEFLNWQNQQKFKAAKKQLRFEAIDALETHYLGFHQPQAFAIAALETLLAMLEITAVAYSLGVTRIVSACDAKPGFIAAAALDRFHRPVSFVFPDDVDLEDGAEVMASALPVEQSVNYRMAEQGLVYPTFYLPLEPEIMAHFKPAIARARVTGRGLWAVDRTAGFEFDRPGVIEEDVVILPKLFRRLASFLDRRGDFDLLVDYIHAGSDKVRLLDEGHDVWLRDLIHVDEREVGLLIDPELIAFHP